MAASRELLSIRGVAMSWGRSASTLVRFELDIASVHSVAIASRARAVLKYFSGSRSMIHTLVTPSTPFPSAGPTTLKPS